MKFLFLGVAAGALGIAAPAAATDTPQAPSKPKKERRICKTAIRSGSNLSTTICKTRAEWAGIEANADPDDEVGVPGNRSATGRDVNVGGMNKAAMDRPREDRVSRPAASSAAATSRRMAAAQSGWARH